MSPSSLRTRTHPAAWRFAILGALISLPITVGVNLLPNSEATIGGGIMIIGAFVAGAIAATRSTDSGAAGLRAGLVAAVVGVLASIVPVSATAAWPLSRAVFFVFVSGLVLCIAPIFGLVFGRVGGWMANTVASR
ncbi:MULTISPECIES: DUF5518 domain-containing protein [Haloferax]|uniref:DUF5518 domain-containing protein n=1 Tax=Haloferax marinum TaxID=2666143 RepID=A0A6A8G4X5_9EURY|nr:MULTISPECIES: DUF5518 domain-containing protein [Haloferax]KAB1196198.1 hypothetical protein Hfx1150_01195 [Haloferax sp. CBA1150]MRW95186.1 hypothetical protein [Haloferax marinum]